MFINKILVFFANAREFSSKVKLFYRKLFILPTSSFALIFYSRVNLEISKRERQVHRRVVF